MSSKSTLSGSFKSGFNGKMAAAAILVAIVFLIIIVIYPRIFNPANIGKNTAPGPMTTKPASGNP